jgi:hypothetical protein
MKTSSILIVVLTAAAPAIGQTQTMYKCPNPAGVLTYQQTPCTPTGGGEAVPVKAISTTGATLEVNEQGREYMAGNKERWEKQAAEDKLEQERQEALAAEHRKAAAAEEQAAALRQQAAIMAAPKIITFRRRP